MQGEPWPLLKGADLTINLKIGTKRVPKQQERSEKYVATKERSAQRQILNKFIIQGHYSKIHKIQ